MVTAVKAPSGRAIWKAVRDELMLNLYPLPFSTIAVFDEEPVVSIATFTIEAQPPDRLHPPEPRSPGPKA